MTSAGEPITILSERESWSLLSSVALGRRVTSVDGQPEISPVNFVVQRRTVVLEADDHNVAEGWSVSVKGTARTLRTDEKIGDAERPQPLPWTATLKQHNVRVIPSVITGRRFRFGSEPDRD